MSALLAVCLLIPTADAKEKNLSDAAMKEIKTLEGKWKAVKVVADGNEIEPMMDGNDLFVTFKGRKFLMADNELFEIAALDPSTKPKLLDFKALMDFGEITKDSTYEGIYKLDGETLTLALATKSGGNRPAKFESEKDSNVVVVTFKREKK